MASQRKRIRNKIDGWLVLDKPVGLSSNDALSRIKRLLHPEKVGHAGTLDPLASGCLPLAFGEATKTVSFAMHGRKVYRFEVSWGTQTTTDDAEGDVMASSQVRPNSDEIRAILPEFTGAIMQRPPAFSAIKVQGQRAYDLARGGEAVELEPRPIDIHRLDLVDHPDENTSVFEAECGKGTYVRSLARDFGRRLGTYGYVTDLRRLLVGPFGEEDMIPLAELQQMAEEGATTEDLLQYIAPVRTALEDLLEIPVDEQAAGRIRQGMAIILRGRDAPLNCSEAFASHAGVPVALGAVDKGEFKPSRVFHL